jgi:hypothetical protein
MNALNCKVFCVFDWDESEGKYYPRFVCRKEAQARYWLDWLLKNEPEARAVMRFCDLVEATNCEQTTR